MMNVASFTLRKTLHILAGLALLLPLALHAEQTDGGGNSFARKVLAEVNLARTQPARYADFLASCRPRYRGDFLALPNQPLTRTHEGVAALDEAVRALRHTRPLAPLSLSSGLGQAAADLARDQARTGLLGHRGGDGSMPFARMSRHGLWHTHAGEVIGYGDVTPRQVVYNLIVDDNVRDRGHRLNLLAPDFRVAGIAWASHPRYRQVCVIDFAVAFTETGALPAPGSDSVVMVSSGPRGGIRRTSVGLVPQAVAGWRR